MSIDLYIRLRVLFGSEDKVKRTTQPEYKEA